MQSRKATLTLILALLLSAGAFAADKPGIWFVAGTVAHGKFVPFNDPSGENRWDSSPKTLEQNSPTAGTRNLPVNLGSYEGQAIFIFVDRAGASESEMYGVKVIGSMEKLSAQQLWNESKGGSPK